MWNAFPGSLLFIACRAGMKRSRKVRMIFVVFREKPASEPSARDVFRKRCPIRGSARDVWEKNILPTSFWGRLFPKSPLRALFLGGFFSNHPFARCFWEAFFQITLSRVVSRRFFFKNSIPMCLEMLFSLGACCSFGCEKRRGSPRLILLVWSFSKLRVSAFQPCSVLSHSRH